MKKKLMGLMLGLSILVSVPSYTSQELNVVNEYSVNEQDQMEKAPTFNWGLRLLGWMTTVIAGNAAVGLADYCVPEEKGSVLGSILRPSMDVFRPGAKWVLPVVSLIPFFVTPALKTLRVWAGNVAKETRIQIKQNLKDSLAVFNEELAKMQEKQISQMTGLMEEALAGMCSTLDAKVAPMVKHIVRDAIIGVSRGATGDFYVKTKKMLSGFVGRIFRSKKSANQSGAEAAESSEKITKDSVRKALTESCHEAELGIRYDDDEFELLEDPTSIQLSVEENE